MRGILAGCILVAVALPGCTVRYSAEERASGTGTTTSQVSVASGSPLDNALNCNNGVDFSFLDYTFLLSTRQVSWL